MSGWETRPPSEIQMGNGTLLVTFDGTGEIEQVFAPNLDATQSRLGSYRTSVLIPTGAAPELLRITRENFDIRLNLEHGSQVLRVEYHHKHRPLKVSRRLGIHPTEPILLDEWKVKDATVGLLHESVPWMGNTTSAHCSLYHPSFNGLVHHRGRRWLGTMALEKTQWVRVGHLNEHDRFRLWSGDRVDPPLQASDLHGFPSGQIRASWDQVVQGCSTWGALAIGPATEMRFALICAESEKHLGRLLDLLKHIPTQRYFQMIESMVTRRHQPAQPTLERIRNPQVRSLCERSIDVLHALQDARTGALMAAAEVDPHSRMSGGYGFSWPRDGAYLASALGAFGFRERVEHYFRFCSETQDPSGAWWQRYLATGHAGPSWGRIQIDEPATVIGAAFLHYRRTQDLFWLERFWPTIEKGLSFLEVFHGKEHPHGLPSHDLWEERMGIHAYSLAAVVSAFRAGAYLARQLGDRRLQVHYYSWSRKLLNVLHENFIPREGPPRRSFVAESGDFSKGHGRWDEMSDVSMLGLITPFGIIDNKHPAAQRMIGDIRAKLWSRPHGGLLRYEWDAYRGGNPWILTTLWLGGVDLALGNLPEAKECFHWTLSKATSVGMLAEQVNRETGKPFWVIPLAWSHAMYLLFVREVLDRKLENSIWEQI